MSLYTFAIFTPSCLLVLIESILDMQLTQLNVSQKFLFLLYLFLHLTSTHSKLFHLLPSANIKVSCSFHIALLLQAQWPMFKSCCWSCVEVLGKPLISCASVHPAVMGTWWNKKLNCNDWPQLRQSVQMVNSPHRR